jgi:hypothetical protein
VPGKYTVRLTVDGKTFAAPLMVKMDPRVKVPESDLQKKLQAETKLASIMDRTNQALSQAASIRAQLDKVNASSLDALKNSVTEFQKKLTEVVGAPGSFFAPPSQQLTLSRVNGNAGTLYQQIWQVDAAPTSSQTEALSSTEQATAAVLKQWSEFKDRELPGLNRVLREGHVPELHPESDFQQDEVDIDEE